MALRYCGLVLALLPLAWIQAQENIPNNVAQKIPDQKEVIEVLEKVRQLKFKNAVPYTYQKPEAFRAFVKKELAKEMPLSQRADRMGGLVRSGLLPKALDLEATILNALGGQALAYYNPEKDTFYYLKTHRSALQTASTTAHELVHALQDQHFDLEKKFAPFLESKPGGLRNEDLLMALRCVVEGEARFVQELYDQQTINGVDLTKEKPEILSRYFARLAEFDGFYMVQRTERLVAHVKSLGGPDTPQGQAVLQDPDKKNTYQSAGTPAFVYQPLVQAYTLGAQLVHQVFRAKGWQGVNALYSQGPLSFEQCLHPEKYLKNLDRPTVINLPKSKALLGEGWTLVDQVIYGEHYLDLLLRQWGLPKEGANKAAAGWDGDHLQIYKNKAGGYVSVWATTWDTKEDALAYFQAYKTVLPKRYNAYGVIKEAPGNLTYTCAGEHDTGRLVLRGHEVFWVEGLPKGQTETVMDELLAYEITQIP